MRKEPGEREDRVYAEFIASNQGQVCFVPIKVFKSGSWKSLYNFIIYFPVASPTSEQWFGIGSVMYTTLRIFLFLFFFNKEVKVIELD